MCDENPGREDDVTPKGAVEVSEEDLDRASGGGIVIEDRPADSFSLNFTRTATTQHKVAATATPPPDDNRL